MQTLVRPGEEGSVFMLRTAVALTLWLETEYVTLTWSYCALHCGLITSQGKNIFVCAVYVPPSGTQLELPGKYRTVFTIISRANLMLLCSFWVTLTIAACIHPYLGFISMSSVIPGWISIKCPWQMLWWH